MGFRVWGLGFRVWSIRVPGLELRVERIIGRGSGRGWRGFMEGLRKGFGCREELHHVLPVFVFRVSGIRDYGFRYWEDLKRV